MEHFFQVEERLLNEVKRIVLLLAIGVSLVIGYVSAFAI